MGKSEWQEGAQWARLNRGREHGGHVSMVCMSKRQEGARWARLNGGRSTVGSSQRWAHLNSGREHSGHV